MRSRFDHFAKQLCRAALLPGGTVLVEEETAPEVETIDLCFVPEPDKRAALAAAGLLGALAKEASLFEFHHQAPGVEDVLVCQHRQMGWFLGQTRAARAQKQPAPERARMWLVSAGRPEQAMTELGFAPRHEVGIGVYSVPPGFRLWLIVINELPEERSTLLMRLMGAGSVLRRAVAEVIALPEDAQERELAVPLLVRLRFELPANANERTPEEEEFLMTGEQLFEEFVRKTREEGLGKGLEKGLEQGRLAEARSALRRVLARRNLPLSAEHETRIDATDELTQLERWLDQAVTAPSADEALSS
jgi:hypothetical protein